MRVGRIEFSASDMLKFRMLMVVELVYSRLADRETLQLH
jgi:hypothetical protein